MPSPPLAPPFARGESLPVAAHGWLAAAPEPPMPAIRRLPRLGALAVAAVLLVAPGCLKRKSTLVLGKDGSGSLTDHVTLDLAKFTEIAEGVQLMAPAMAKYVEAGKGGTDIAD